MITVFFLQILSFFFANIGFRGCRICAYFTGFLAFDILAIRKKIVMHNLDIAFGNSLSHRDKKKLGRMSHVNFLTTIFETLGSQKLFDKAHVEFENKEFFDKSILSSKISSKGIYALVIHSGNFELIPSVHPKQNYDSYVVVKEFFRNNEKARNYVKNTRRKNGFGLIENTENLSRASQIFQAINNKKIAAIVVDQKSTKGEMVPFFGKMASTDNSLAKFYFRKQAPIIPLLITRIKPGFFKIKYFEDFSYEKNPNYSLKENITEFTKNMNIFVEKMILECPQEYMWGHNRWNYGKK